jgi:hypothetical protein
MKHTLLFEQFIAMINEAEKFPMPERDSTEWKKMGADWHWSVPFDEFKSRAVGKTNFVTTDSPKEIDVEKYFYDQAHNHDGRAHVKILKMFKKHEGEYKHSGERWEEYQSWIVQAMVRQGNMVQV